MPSEVQPATVAEVLGTAPATPQPAAPVAAPADVDRNGTPFDPDRHLPRPHPKTGVWIPRRRPASAAQPAPKPAAEAASTPPPAVEPAPDLSDIARAAAGGTAEAAPAGPLGSATVETCIGIVQMLFMLAGEEEGLLSDVEKLMIRQSASRILAKYQIGNDAIPCELEAFMLLAVMFLERVKRGKKTATFFAKAKAWLASVFFRAKGAAVGSQLRQEAPGDLIAKLNAEVATLRAQLAAKTAATGGAS